MCIVECQYLSTPAMFVGFQVHPSDVASVALVYGGFKPPSYPATPGIEVCHPSCMCSSHACHPSPL